MIGEIRMRVTKDGADTKILAMVTHPMETGRRKDSKTKELIPAHHIEKFEFAINGKTIASANLGAAVSKNPMVGIKIKQVNSGDKLTISWTDNKGEQGSADKTI